MATQKAQQQAAADAKLAEKDFVTRLADAGEEALQRLSELPGGQRAVGAFNDLRSRVDELAKKVRGIDALEARVAKLEKEVAELKRARRAPAKRASTRKRPSGGT
jgi:uncharacterized protein YceH (UPF0502 family)